MTTQSTRYAIGSPNIPWGDAEKQQWFKLQEIKRSYRDQVLSKLESVSEAFSRTQYGFLPQDSNRYPLYAFTNVDYKPTKPTVLITGGVHGYETSGVHGAIEFLLNHGEAYIEDFNLIIAPCVSPWGYETINRWNAAALDPNRSFYPNSPSPEAMQLMQFVQNFCSKVGTSIYAHIDLHETTDTDNSEFRPALAARDAIELVDWGIPDGFYTVADTQKPVIEFQQAVICAVSKVTHIAPADPQNKIIGADVVSEGVICYDKSALFLCAGFTKAPYVTTTEVYPDSPSASPESCIVAQVAAITGALNYLQSI